VVRLWLHFERAAVEPDRRRCFDSYGKSVSGPFESQAQRSIVCLDAEPSVFQTPDGDDSRTFQVERGSWNGHGKPHLQRSVKGAVFSSKHARSENETLEVAEVERERLFAIGQASHSTVFAGEAGRRHQRVAPGVEAPVPAAPLRETP
jgi:hypothetical protein